MAAGAGVAEGVGLGPNTQLDFHFIPMIQLTG